METSLLALQWLGRTYREVWNVDFEYRESPEGFPIPVCMVARELFNRLPPLYLFGNEMVPGKSPFHFGKDTLFVAYSSTAELSCFLALGWEFPTNVLDLFPEFRFERNTIFEAVDRDTSLLDALTYFGLDALEHAEKEEMRDLILSNATYSPAQKQAILNYCLSDVIASERLVACMLPRIPGLINEIQDGSKKHPGFTPIDAEKFNAIYDNREAIIHDIIDAANRKFDVFDGLVFKTDKFETMLKRFGFTNWPRTKTGKPSTREDVFEEMVIRHPILESLWVAYSSRNQLGESSLVVKPDGYSRPYLNPFGSNTGRTRPKKPPKTKGLKWANTKGRFIFGMSRWLRRLTQPKPGRAICYLDWKSQEIGIQAGLSGDQNMIKAYQSGDFYLGFAKMAGAAPPEATKATHGEIREMFKAPTLASSYGQGAKSLARKTGLTELDAQDLLDEHHRLFSTFWSWTENATRYAPRKGEIFSPLGWRMRIVQKEAKKADGRPRNVFNTLLNWPVQSAGADSMRLAACLGTEAGLNICCSVHDAFLIESSVENIKADCERMVAIMEEASRIVSGGVITVGVDYEEDKIIYHPGRYVDPKDKTNTWDKALQTIQKIYERSNTDQQ